MLMARDVLNPETRQTLLDALRPPAGFRLGCAVGTTYALNLDAALTAPAAFALYAASHSTDTQTLEPLELLDSIRRHASKFTVFFQAGQVAVPLQRRLFAFLEGAVIPVLAPRGGVFHPKVWAIRFESDDGPPVYRALCSTRNLTYDRSWDTMLRLDSVSRNDDEDSELVMDPAGLAGFIRALPGIAIGQVSDQRRSDIAALADQLEVVRWGLPIGVRSGKFVPLGIEESSKPPFPPTADRLVVVSPFLTAGLLNKLPESVGRRVLIANADQIAACSATVGKQFSEVYTLDADAMPVSLDDDHMDARKELHTSHEDPKIPFEGLHAKLFMFDSGDTTTVLTGSANATSAAFCTNVEFVTELTGSRDAIGVEALLARPDGDVQTLMSFLVQVPLDKANEHQDLRDPEEDALDVLRRVISSTPFEARAVPNESDDWFRLSFTNLKPIPSLPEGVTWRSWPITLGYEGSRPVDPTGSLDQPFRVSFEGITGFFANELVLGDVSTRFVLTADLVEAPSNRSTRLLRLLLVDVNRLLRYLLMLLADDVMDSYGQMDMLDIGGSDGWQTAPDSLPLLEALLRALSRDPVRLEHLHQLIVDLLADSGEDTFIPSDLLEMWEPIWAAAKERDR